MRDGKYLMMLRDGIGAGDDDFMIMTPNKALVTERLDDRRRPT